MSTIVRPSQPGPARLPAPAAAPSAASRNVELFSCDVFDTVITRAIGQPASLFLLLGRRLRAAGLIGISPDGFMAARKVAEGRAKANQGRGWTLAGIYRELQYALGLSDAVRDDIMAHELGLERELLRPVPGAQERIRAARDAGMRVAFLSDMYLDSSFIRIALADHGLCTDGDACHVSSETGCGKEDGRAFRRLAEREGIAPSRILHRGNDLVGDVRGARKARVRSEHCDETNPNRYEKALETWTSATEGLASVMAGASRLARLSVGAASRDQAALRDVAAGVGGPLLTSYVLWLLREAQRTGLRRLYFLSRDGWILLGIAERLVAKLGLDIELRYLHGGRRAWYMAAVTDVEQTDLSWAVDSGVQGDSVESFLRRLELEPQDFADELESLGHPRGSWSTPIPPAAHASLWSIPKHPAIRRRLLEHAARRRDDVLAYCQQEGLLDAADWALVDVGWSGRVVGALDRILACRGGRVPAAFFFARFVDPLQSPLQRDVPIHSWFSDHQQRVGYVRLVNELFLELFCGAEHGAVIGYERGPEGVTPRFASAGHPALTRWGLPIVHETILAFVDQLWLDPVTVDPSANMRAAAAQVFWTFIRTPTLAEARAWGAYPFEYGRTGVMTSSIAAHYRLRHIAQALRSAEVSNRTHTEWFEAGMVMTPQPLRFALRASLALRRRMGPLARRLISRLQAGRA